MVGTTQIQASYSNKVSRGLCFALCYFEAEWRSGGSPSEGLHELVELVGLGQQGATQGDEAAAIQNYFNSFTTNIDMPVYTN